MGPTANSSVLKDSSIMINERSIISSGSSRNANPHSSMIIGNRVRGRLLNRTLTMATITIRANVKYHRLSNAHSARKIRLHLRPIRG